MFRGKFLYTGEDLSQYISVRNSIPELHVSDNDEFDLMAIYALAFDESDTPCGCGRLYIGKDSRFHIDLLGVLPTHRGIHIGDLLARMLLYKAEILNAGSVRLIAPAPIVPFFTRYGLRPIGEKTSLHGEDAYLCHVDGDKIVLEGTCSCSKDKSCGGNCESCASKC